jgi:hypothetical protein
MDAVEFEEWKAYYRVEPFGDDWQQAGTIAAATVNTWSKRKVKPEQFIPKTKARKSPEEIERQMNQWARAYNARLKQDGHHRKN